MGAGHQVAGCARQEPGLAGEWRGVGTDGQRLVLILKPDHDFRMVTGNEAVDASMYPNTQYRWTADTTHTPNRLTLTTIMGDQHLTIRVIYSLLDRNTLAMRFGVTSSGEPVDWERMTWDSAGPGSKQLVLERNPRID